MTGKLREKESGMNDRTTEEEGGNLS